MRAALMLVLAAAAVAGPADRTLARWTLIEGGRVAIAGKVYTDAAELPAGDFEVEMADWVAVNAVPEDLERLGGLRALRELRLPGPLWNRNADAGKDLSRQLGHLAPVRTLEKLTFSDHFLDRIRFRDAGLDAVAPLAGLRELAIRQAEVKGPGLRHFANLESLDITLCPVSDLAPVSGMRGLKRLLAGDTLIAGLQALRDLKELEVLDLHGTSVGDEDVEVLRALTRLRWLDLRGTRITDASAAILAGLPALESVNLYRTQISNTGLAQLQALRRLRELDVRYTRVTGTGLDGFRAVLPAVRVQSSAVDSRQSVPVAPPVGREWTVMAEWVGKLGGTSDAATGAISLRGVPLSDAALHALADTHGLRKLELEATETSDGALAALARAGALEELSLNSTPVSDAGLRHLAKLPRLRRISLNNTYVEGTAFSAFSPNSPMTEISLLGAPATDAAMGAIARLRNVRQLNIAESDVTNGGIAALSALPLEQLDVAAADVGDDAPWESFKALRMLRLRDTKVTDKTVASRLGALTALRHLDLARTKLTNAATAGLAQLTELQSLDVSYSDIDDAGVKALQGLAKLQVLQLDSTLVTDGAAAALATFPVLREVNLYHTLVSAKGVERIRSTLPKARVIWDADSGLPHRRRA